MLPFSYAPSPNQNLLPSKLETSLCRQESPPLRKKRRHDPKWQWMHDVDAGREDEPSAVGVVPQEWKVGVSSPAPLSTTSSPTLAFQSACLWCRPT